MTVHLVNLLNLYILYYFLVLCACYTLLLVISMPIIVTRFRESLLGEIFPIELSASTIPVSIIIPAYNEQHDIINCVESALNSTYKNLKIIVVNDGSIDETLSLLQKTYQLHQQNTIIAACIPTAKIKTVYNSKIHPQLWVIDKEHSGTGDTFNAGVNAAHTPLFFTLDADSMLEPDTIARLVQRMLSEKHAVAAGGGVYILNDCEISRGKVLAHLPKKYLTILQACEYLRSFLFARAGLNIFKGALCFSGTCTLLEHDAVLEIGGFDTNNRSQDAEIITHLHQYMRAKKYPYNITFTPAAFTWTMAPDTFKSYAHQRINWHRGMMRSYLRYFRMFFNPHYGATGMFTYPLYLLIETFGPVVELTAYLLVIASIILGIFNLDAFAVFILLSAGFSAFLTAITMLINMLTFNKYRTVADVITVFGYSLIEMVGFRQFAAVIRTWGVFKYFSKKPVFTKF